MGAPKVNRGSKANQPTIKPKILNYLNKLSKNIQSPEVLIRIEKLIKAIKDSELKINPSNNQYLLKKKIRKMSKSAINSELLYRINNCLENKNFIRAYQLTTYINDSFRKNKMFSDLKKCDLINYKDNMAKAMQNLPDNPFDQFYF